MELHIFQKIWIALGAISFFSGLSLAIFGHVWAQTKISPPHKSVFASQINLDKNAGNFWTNAFTPIHSKFVLFNLFEVFNGKLLEADVLDFMPGMNEKKVGYLSIVFRIENPKPSQMPKLSMDDDKAMIPFIYLRENDKLETIVKMAQLNNWVVEHWSVVRWFLVGFFTFILFWGIILLVLNCRANAKNKLLVGCLSSDN